jgi:hypothetical protein
MRRPRPSQPHPRREDRKPNPNWGDAQEADRAASFQEELARALAEKAEKIAKERGPDSPEAVKAKAEAEAGAQRAKELRDKANALKSKFSVPCLVAGRGGCADDRLPGLAPQPAPGARVPGTPSVKVPQIIPRFFIPEFLIP